MEENPLDIQQHEKETPWDVWKRRLLLGLLIAIVISFAAPTFGGCQGALGSGGHKVVARFEVAGRLHEVTDDQIGRTEQRWGWTEAVRSNRFPELEGEQGRRAVLTRMMLDAAAQAEGVHVPDARVAAELAGIRQFQVGGRFDERAYREFLSDRQRGARGNLNHETLTQTLREDVRIREYEGLYVAAFGVLPGEKAYETWKKRNARLTVDYVVSPFDAVRAQAESETVSDEALRSVENMPAVRALLEIPPRKTVEVAYAKAADLTPAEVEAARKFVTDAEIFSEEYPLEAAAFVTFHADRTTVYTRDRWVETTDPGYPERRAQHEKALAEWEKKPEAERGPRPEPPADPAASYPEAEAEQFALWKDRLVREVLVREVVKHLVGRANREGKPLAEIGPEYARFGVKVVRNETPLTDAEIVEKFPDPVARDSEFDQVARVKFKPPAEGAVFKPVVHPETVPTTRVAERLADRGTMALRLDACDPQRRRDVAEMREKVTEFWRANRVAELARARLDELRRKAEAAGADPQAVATALRAAAAEAGLEVRTLRRFNRSTTEPKVPVPGPGETFSADVEAAARRIAWRNRVQRDYELLSKLEPGKFRDPVLVDDAEKAAFLLLVVERREPTPTEMDDRELDIEKLGLYDEVFRKVGDLLGYDALAKRFSLQRFDDVKEPAKTEPGAGQKAPEGQ